MPENSLPTGFTNEQLTQLFQRFLQEHMSTQNRTLFRDLWASYCQYITTPTDGGRPRLASSRCAVGYTKNFMSFFGDMPWSEITLVKADEYRRWRTSQPSPQTKRPLKASSLNRELRTLQAALSYAQSRGLIPENPLRDMKDDPSISDRDFALTKEQFLALLKHARPQLRMILLLLIQSGMRRNEVRLLEWSEVDLNAGVITLAPHRTKNRKGRLVPITTVMRIVLEMVPRDGQSPYVFPNPKKSGGPIPAGTLNDWRIEACEAAGIAGPRGQRVWLHTLRHTWATSAMISGMDVETLMQIGGWSDPKVMRLYLNISGEHRMKAASKIDGTSGDLIGMLKGSRSVIRREARRAQQEAEANTEDKKATAG